MGQRNGEPEEGHPVPVGQSGEAGGGKQSQHNLGRLFGLAALASVPGVAHCRSTFWICMWVIGPGGATIYPCSGGRVTMGA